MTPSRPGHYYYLLFPGKETEAWKGLWAQRRAGSGGTGEMCPSSAPRCLLAHPLDAHYMVYLSFSSSLALYCT